MSAKPVKIKNTEPFIPGIATHRAFMNKMPDSEALAFYDMLPIGILAQDGSGTVLFSNKAAREMLDLDEEQLSGKNPPHDGWRLIRMDGTEIPVTQGPSATALRTGREVRDQEVGVFHQKAGMYYWMNVSVFPTLLPGGNKPALFYSTYIDITSQVIYKKQERERYKELQALYQMNSLLEMQALSLDTFFERLLSIIVDAWQYPSVAAARITVDERNYTTPNYRPSTWSQIARIHAKGVEIGQIEVVYLEKRPYEFEGPFLKEERMLISAIAERVGKVVQRFTLQKKVQEDEKRFHGIVDNMTEGVILLDWDLKYLYLNDSAEMMNHRPAWQLLGHSMVECWPGIENNPVFDLHRKVLREREPAASIGEFDFETGEPRWYHWNIQPASEGLLVLMRDITERFHAQEVIAARETRINDLSQTLQAREDQRTAEFKDLYDHAPVGYHTINADGLVTNINQTELDWLGYTAEEVIGKLKITDLIAPDSVQIFQANFAEIQEGGKVLNQELLFQRKDSSTFMGLINVYGEFAPDGAFIGTRASVMDITERRKADVILQQSSDELSRVNAELLRANRAKDDFLASMSHELRTPLTGVLGLADVLEMESLGSLNDRQRQALADLHASGHQLLDMVNEIIDYSKIEASRLVLDLEDCAVLPILQNCMVVYGPVAAKKHLDLTLQAGNEDMILRADPRRIKQMVGHLLSNAIKFTPQNGKVRVTVTDDSDSEPISISVQDTGPGILAEDMSRMYMPFLQLDAGLARMHGGIGLGLALTARLADLHGGSIHVESEPGKGACFTLRLPRAVMQKPGEKPEITERRATIAVADDNEAILMAISDSLRSRGFSVSTARNGLELIHLVKRERPSVILTDVRMPGMDGIVLVRELRNQESTYFKQVPILVMTAYGVPDSRRQFLQAGATAFFEKPVSILALLEWLRPFNSAKKLHN